jgi:hypothetical protein
MAMQWEYYYLILLWYSLWHHYVFSGHWNNYLLQAVQASLIFLDVYGGHPSLLKY